VEAIKVVVCLGNKKLAKVLAVVAADTSALEMEVP
jgi:hypothetical protein